MGNGGALAARPATSALGVVGDSWTANCIITSGTTLYKSSEGYLWHALSELGQPFRVVALDGVSGENTGQIAVRLPAMIAQLPIGAIVIVQGGSNENGTDATITEANLAGMYNRIMAAGMRPVGVTIPPDNTASSGQSAARMQVNQWLRRQAQERPGFILCDWTPAFGDSTGGLVIAGTSLTKLSKDGRHLITLGARRAGVILANTLRPLVRPGSTILPDVNGHDAAQILANPLQFGTTGTVGAGGAGNAPTSWREDRVTQAGANNDATFTVAKAARADYPNLEWTVLGCTSQGTGATPDVLAGVSHNQFIQLAGGLFAVGDQLVAAAEFQTDAYTSRTHGVFLEVKCMTAGFASLMDVRDQSVQFDTVNDADASDNHPIVPMGNDQARAGVLRTLPFTVPVGTTQINFSVSLFAVGVARIGRCDFRKNLTAAVA